MTVRNLPTGYFLFLPGFISLITILAYPHIRIVKFPSAPPLMRGNKLQPIRAASPATKVELGMDLQRRTRHVWVDRAAAHHTLAENKNE